jgi:RimJ/RimL family protein N-acetyltransferase
MRVRRRGMRSGTRLVRLRASQRAGGARTQTANDRSMRLAAKLGFTEVERFEEYGAEQWLGVW